MRRNRRSRKQLRRKDIRRYRRSMSKSMRRNRRSRKQLRRKEMRRYRRSMRKQRRKHKRNKRRHNKSKYPQTGKKPSRYARRRKFKPKYVRDRITSGSQIYSNQYLMSQNKRYMAKLDQSGNFNVYKLSGNKKINKWSTNTKGKGVQPYRLKLKSNGNLVLYDAKNYKIWTSRTKRLNAKPQIYSLIMKNNGNLVLMIRNRQVWSTNTWENKTSKKN